MTIAASLGMRSVRASVALLAVTPALAHAQDLTLIEDDPAAEVTLAEEASSAGTLEVGGAVGASFSDDISAATAAATGGFFPVTGIQLSLTFQIAYLDVKDRMGDTVVDTGAALLFEPSFHYPLGGRVLLVGGLGVGGGYDGDEIAGQIVPSLGFDVVATRRMILTPALRVPIAITDTTEPGYDFDADVGFGLDVGISAI